MSLAEAAIIARTQGDPATARRRFEEAFSAGSLALNCQQYRIAEKLLAVGLAGEPPSEIADEIRDLLEQVYAHRELLAS